MAAAALVVASGAMIGQAAAADLEYIPAPAPPPFVPTWQGFYIGGNVGYGEGNFETGADVVRYDFDPVLEVFAPGVAASHSSGFTADGLIGGVQGGYNWQVNALVFGIEGDISFADWSHGSQVFDNPLDPLGIDGGVEGNVSTDIDFLASIRGRLGMAFGNALIYGTGGVAFADAKARLRVDHVDGDTVNNIFEESADFGDVGFVIGGGLGWMVIPQTFSVGVEGLYYFFDETRTLFEADRVPLANGDERDIHATATLDDAWVIRARADFHF
jgi:outer membrane immunogenic protein